MNDRGIIKWLPFDSCFSSKKTLCEIEAKKRRRTLPLLSEDQINDINQKIKQSYLLKLEILIVYFWDGNLYEINGIIDKIDLENKNIIINNKIIYFNQICEAN